MIILYCYAGLGNKLISHVDAEAINGRLKMSFGNLNKAFGTIQEALILALMVITMITLFYVNIDFNYKVGIAIFTFAIVFLATLANAMLQAQRELKNSRLTRHKLFFFSFTFSDLPPAWGLSLLRCFK